MEIGLDSVVERVDHIKKSSPQRGMEGSTIHHSVQRKWFLQHNCAHLYIFAPCECRDCVIAIERIINGQSSGHWRSNNTTILIQFFVHKLAHFFIVCFVFLISFFFFFSIIQISFHFLHLCYVIIFPLKLPVFGRWTSLSDAQQNGSLIMRHRHMAGMFNNTRCNNSSLIYFRWNKIEINREHHQKGSC